MVKDVSSCKSFIHVCIARNFDKSGKEHDGSNIHTADNKGKDDQKPQSSELRKTLGIRITDSIEEVEEEEDVKTKNLAKYLGMKDGVSTSIASQVNGYYLTLKNNFWCFIHV